MTEVSEQQEDSKKGRGRPVTKVPREEIDEVQRQKSILLEPSMHRDLKLVSAVLGKNMRDVLMDAFYSNSDVAQILEQMKRIKK